MLVNLPPYTPSALIKRLMNWFSKFLKRVAIICFPSKRWYLIVHDEEGSHLQMSGSLADTSVPFFSYTEFTPVKSRKKRKNRTQRQEPVLTLIQGIRDDMVQSNWFSQCKSSCLWYHLHNFTWTDEFICWLHFLNRYRKGGSQISICGIFCFSALPRSGKPLGLSKL